MALGPGKSASDSPPRRPPCDGVSHSFSWERGNLMFLPKETLSIRGAFCVFPQDKDSVYIQEQKHSSYFHISTRPGNSSQSFFAHVRSVLSTPCGDPHGAAARVIRSCAIRRQWFLFSPQNPVYVEKETE